MMFKRWHDYALLVLVCMCTCFTEHYLYTLDNIRHTGSYTNHRKLYCPAQVCTVIAVNSRETPPTMNAGWVCDMRAHKYIHSWWPVPWIIAQAPLDHSQIQAVQWKTWAFVMDGTSIHCKYTASSCNRGKHSWKVTATALAPWVVRVSIHREILSSHCTCMAGKQTQLSCGFDSLPTQAGEGCLYITAVMSGLVRADVMEEICNIGGGRESSGWKVSCFKQWSNFQNGRFVSGLVQCLTEDFCHTIGGSVCVCDFLTWMLV